MAQTSASTFDICIRGAGIVGRSLALLLARERLRVALVDASPPAPVATPNNGDVRAYALNAASRALLESVRGWPQAQHVGPVRQMQVFSDQGAFVQFDAAEQACDALAWIVDVPALESRLADALDFQPLVERVSAPLPAPLTLVCEGRASQTREQWGVNFDITPYGQHAIATRLECAQPHGEVARQWFLPDGSILAFLPLGGGQGNQVAVVWSIAQEHAAHWLAAEEADFTQQLEAASAHTLGSLRLIAPRASWPLQQALAQRWYGVLPQSADQPPQAWALVGDAAHNVHPLAGQGLNLGLADVQALAQLLRERPTWRPLNDVRLLRQYERQRKAALLPMRLAMDGLQQLFAHPHSGVQSLRNWGFGRFESCPPLKAWVARLAMG